MAGRKTFVAGEILTASDVNSFLMNQAVQVYDDATARDIALPSPLEGQLVYLKNNDTVQKFDGSNFLPVANPGIGSNVVQTVKSDIFASTSTSFTNVPGLSVTITPSSSTSRILILGQISAGRGTQGRLTGGNSAGFVGDAAGSRTRATFTGPGTSAVGENPRANPTYSLVFLDSPATASAVTYQIQVRFENTGSGDPGAQINRRTTDTDEAFITRNVSSLVAIEVAP